MRKDSFKRQTIWDGAFLFEHFDKNGNLKHKEICKNGVFQQGENLMLDVFWRGQNYPTQFYLRLANDSPSYTDTLINITNEPVGNGYDPILIERSVVGFPTLELNSGDWRVVSKAVSYIAAGGAIGPVNMMYVSTTSDNTGKIISYAPLSVQRTAVDGDTFQTQYLAKLRN